MVVKKLYHLSVDCTRAYKDNDIGTPQLLKKHKENYYRKIQETGIQQGKKKQIEQHIEREEKIKEKETFYEYKQRIAKKFWEKREKHESLKNAYVNELWAFNAARKEKKTEKAIAIGTILTVIQPQKYSSYKLLAGQLWNNKEKEKAIEVMKEAQTYHGTNKEVFRDIAEAYYKLGKYRKALKNYDRMIELTRNNENIMKTKKDKLQEIINTNHIELLRNQNSRTFKNTKISETATRQIEGMLKQRSIHYQRIQCMMKLGNYEQIVSEYELFVNIYPTKMVGITTRVMMAMIGQCQYSINQVIPRINNMCNRIIKGDVPSAMAPLINSICHAYQKNRHQTIVIRLTESIKSYETDLSNVLKRASIDHTIIY
mmetsp:Transcript_9326/g.13810  ORF Transcript_9326/g.13810 Transcript_9326/m.13810 type:complete len:371 (+) Transcript_9326:25-1137(+)